MTINNPYTEGRGMSQAGAQPAMDGDIVRRPELTAVVESLNREFSGFTATQTAMNIKLDQLISNKTMEATEAGALSERVRRLGVDVQEQARSIAQMQLDANKNQVAPRDALLKFVKEIALVIAAAAVGYLLHIKV